MHDEEAAGTRDMEIEPEKFRPQYKVHKIFRVGAKTRVGRVSGNNKFWGLMRTC